MPAYTTSNLSGFSLRRIGAIIRDDKGGELSSREGYQQEKPCKWREEAHSAAIGAAYEQLPPSENPLLDRKAGISADKLIEAIDDYVKNLTGDRCALHVHHHSMGGSR